MPGCLDAFPQLDLLLVVKIGRRARPREVLVDQEPGGLVHVLLVEEVLQLVDGLFAGGPGIGLRAAVAEHRQVIVQRQGFRSHVAADPDLA